MADRIGQQLGNYRLTRLLGEGGFAQVYLGEHIHLGTEAAIKVLTARLTTEEIEQFRSEARTIARLRHPHIVRVLDFGVDHGVPFLVMDYAPNGTLRQRYPKGTRLTLTTILPHIKQVAAALQYAHDQKLVHRDVKPENMLLEPDNTILLSDFGIAVVAHSSHSMNTQDIIGTVAYMAPEQLQGKPRLASDQYALAVVVYEWLSGSWPFNGAYVEIAMQHALTPPPPLREKVPAISPEVEQVVMKALAKDPHQRFTSVQDFATALEKASRPARSRTPVPPPQTQYIPAQPPRGAAAKPASAIKPEEFTLIRTLQGHSNALSSVAFSPDGQTLASGSEDKTIKLWNLYTGQLLHTLQGHSNMVWSVAISPDGKSLASGSWDQTIKLWNLHTGQLLHTLQGHSKRVSSVAFSPDGQTLASGSWDNTIKLWNLPTGQLLRTLQGHSNTVLSVAISPDGQILASGSGDKTIKLWNLHTGQLLRTLQGHSIAVSSVAFSPDGQFLASGSGDKTIKIWGKK